MLDFADSTAMTSVCVIQYAVLMGVQNALNVDTARCDTCLGCITAACTDQSCCVTPNSKTWQWSGLLMFNVLQAQRQAIAAEFRAATQGIYSEIQARRYYCTAAHFVRDACILL